MDNKKQSLRYISGIAMLIWGIYGLIFMFSQFDWEIGEFLGYIFDFEYFEYNITTYSYIAAISAAILAGIFVIANKNARIFVCVAFAFYALDYISLMLINLLNDYGGWAQYLLYAAPFILASLFFLPPSIINLPQIKKFWFIPVIIDLISWFKPIFDGYDFNYIFENIDIINMLIEITAVALICYWGFSDNSENAIKSFHEKKSAQKTYYNENNTIEEIKKFHELLDSGVITQEEFDEKKKQLLEN